jgi:peptidoglycan/LPS O-acetylase OafA/YrhL
MDAVAIGCVLAGSARWFEQRTSYRRFLQSRWLAGVVVAVAACNALDRYPAFYLPVGMTVRNLGIALIVHAAILRSNRVISSALDSDAAKALGRMSYSLYLWQQPFLNRHQPGMLTAFPTNVAAAFLCATLSFRCVESGVLRARQRARRDRASVTRVAELADHIDLNISGNTIAEARQKIRGS